MRSEIEFWNKFGVKLFRATVVNAKIGGLNVLPKLFDMCLDHMLGKFEQNRMVRNNK